MGEQSIDGWIQEAVWTDEQTCRFCSRVLPITLTGTCPACDSVHCPFCAVASHYWENETFDLNDEPCGHLLGSFSDDLGDWEFWPFYNLRPPRLPTDLGPRAVDWSEADKRQLLGPLRPILEAYERSTWYPRAALADRPDEAILFDRLFDQLTTPRRAISWSPRGLGLDASGGTDYFVADARRARAEIRATLAELIRRLQRHGGPTGPDRRSSA
jgi:hypothetical protein